MTQVDNFILHANFNKWVNEKIITFCNKLTEIAYKKDRAAFPPFIHGTLNHFLVNDISAYLTQDNFNEIVCK